MSHHPERHLIIGIHVINRTEKAVDVQNLLTEFGCYIKTRIGLHDASPEFCSPNGVILLEILDNEERRAQLVGRLREIEGIDIQEMIFEH